MSDTKWVKPPWRWGWNDDTCAIWGIAIVLCGHNKKEKEDHARLIAAAPELYEALELITECDAFIPLIGSKDTRSDDDRQHDEARMESLLANAMRVLKKARGEL